MAPRQKFLQREQAQDVALLMLDELPALVWRTDSRGACDYCNKSWQQFTGRRQAQESGDGWLENVHPDDLPSFLQTLRGAMAACQSFEMECRLRRADGQYRWFICMARPYQRADGTLGGYLGSCYDITEHKRLEDHLRHAQKMEAIGRLAGGVAHDFNNLLTAMTGYLTFIHENLPPDHVASDDAEQALRVAERAANLTQQLLVFSRRQSTSPSAVNLNDVVSNLTKMLRRLISEEIDLVTIPEPDLGVVRVDVSQIEQVLINLVVNAGDAMPEGGRLTIETANVVLDEQYAHQHIGVVPGAYVMLAVSDTGVGMGEEVKAHIFEPFFTTKEPGKGTGLGLATCYAIVRQNGGHIGFYSELGKGSTFKIYFPQVEGVTRAARPSGLEPTVPADEPHTVLLVEDDEAVREYTGRVLERAGYIVLEAADGAEALDIAARHNGEGIDLLITDVVMPRVGGEELAQRLRRCYPGLRALYMSGYTANAVVHSGSLPKGSAFLQKPFTPATLTHQVREVLATPPMPELG